MFVVVAPVAETPVVGPVVLDHVDPQSEEPEPEPDHRREAQVAHEQPQQREVEHLCDHAEHRVRHEPERPGLEYLVAGHVGLALVGHQAEVHRPPEAIGSELVGIARMIGELVVEPVPVNPGDRVHVDAEGVVHERDGLDEPLLVVERAMGDAHVDHAGQVHAADEPARHEVGRADSKPVQGPISGGAKYMQASA